MRNVAVLLLLVCAASMATAKTGSEHVADMCAVFGVCGDHPRLLPLFRTITSEMDSARTGRQKYTMNQRMKNVEPSFEWGAYTHRLFFHWGFNGDPKESEALKDKINSSTEDPERRERLWKVVMDEHKNRNRRMKKAAKDAVSYTGTDGKQKGVAKPAINGIAALAYDTHILGDYIEGKDIPRKALFSLQRTQEDIVKAVRRITQSDPDFEGEEDRKMFERRMKWIQGGIEKIRAEKALQIMKEYVPKILMKAGTLRRVLELDKYSVQDEIRQAA